MSMSEIILYSVMVVLFILGGIRLLSRAEYDDRAPVPKSVWLSHVSDYTAQEVFDWVAYVTKVTGKRYLDQMVWDHKSQHDFLLSDLQTVTHAKSTDELLEHLKLVAKDHNLDSSIVDAPY